MADYMNMIKNPKPKSPRAQTSPLSRNQNESPSSPKANSGSKMNLSSLNRPMASNSRNAETNLYNPLPLSRRSSQVENPLNKSSEDLLRRSTPSFIGETTSQIIYRTPPAGEPNMLRSLSGSTRGLREDYDGLNRASQISRRSQIGPTERSPTFRGANDSMRDSLRRSSIKLEKKKANKRKIDLPVIILGIIVIAIGFLILRSIFPSSVVYCDNGDDIGIIPGCVPCPPHAYCQNGEITGCKQGFTLHKSQCVEDFEVKMRFQQYRKFINDKLTIKKGEQLCNPSVDDSLTLNDVLLALREKFGQDKYLTGSKEDFLSHFSRKGTEGLYSSYDKDRGIIIFKTNDAPNPSFSCKMSLLWTEGKIFGLWLALFIATVVILVKYAIARAVYTNLAAEVYAEVLDYLSYWQKSTVKTLKREFEDKYPDKDFEKLWHYVEELVIKGGRINKFFDYYQNEVQEFWVLLY